MEWRASHILVKDRPFAQELLKKIKLPAPTVREVLSYLRSHCSLERPVPVPKDACRDPKDLPILGLAVAASADCLVTGDEDLVVLKRHHETQILAPRQFHDRLRQK